MSESITTIALKLPLMMGSVNVYLLKTAIGFVLIDTGYSNERSTLEAQLRKAGCASGNLRLIILTHGDFDHIANAAYLQRVFKTKVAMHAEDAIVAQKADMFINKNTNAIMKLLVKGIFLLANFRSEKFRPDVFLQGGEDLSAYGLQGEIIYTPGHSKGSISVLLRDGSCFCGDEFTNLGQPKLNSLVDELSAMQRSAEELHKFSITTVYPGHGKAFLMNNLSL